MPAKVLKKVGVEIDHNYLYFLNKKGDVSRTLKVGPPGKRPPDEVVSKTHVKRERGYAYFLNKDGDVCSVKINTNIQIKNMEIRAEKAAIAKKNAPPEKTGYGRRKRRKVRRK